MVQAVIAGAVAVLLWVLSRVPGFTAAGRLHWRVERDTRLLQQLPPGVAHDRLRESVESDVLRLLRMREPRSVSPLTAAVLNLGVANFDLVGSVVVLSYPLVGLVVWFVTARPDTLVAWLLFVTAASAAIAAAMWSLARIPGSAKRLFARARELYGALGSRPATADD